MRYYLFAGSSYYPNLPFQDLRKISNDLDELKNLSKEYDWAQIFDITYLEVHHMIHSSNGTTWTISHPGNYLD